MIKSIDFLHSLLLTVATNASLAYAPPSPLPDDWRRDLWRGPADESDEPGGAAEVYTTAIITGGPATTADPVPRISVQWATFGGYAAALTRAEIVAASLCDENGTPRIAWSFTGKTATGADDGAWRVIGVSFLQRPGLVSRSEGQAMFAFNTDISFSR